MAKAKEPKAPKEKKPKAAKSKSGGGLQALLLKKGEWIALGGAAACLAILLLWGVKQGAKAVINPETESAKMVQSAKNIKDRIQTGEPAPADVPEVPAWVTSTQGSRTVPVSEFPITGPLFDITARPDTKRDNPVTLGIEEFQIDLVKAPMKAYDIIRRGTDGYNIGVRTQKTTQALDPAAVRAAREAIQRRQGQNRRTPTGGAAQQPPAGGAAQPPAGGAGGGGEGAQGAAGGGGSGRGGDGGGAFGFGGAGSFEANAARTETVIQYVPLETLDAEIAAGKVPAATVVPLRMVVIHATIPLKKQIEEIKRALRMKETTGIDPVYDGYEIQRREVGPRGVVKDWPAGADALKWNYDFEGSYIDLIASRKIVDHFDVTSGDTQYLPYFLRYEQALALPLPELVTELGAYPEIRLPLITDTIAKMKAAARQPVSASAVLTRLERKGARPDLYTPTGAAGANAMGGAEGIQAPGGGRGAGGAGGAPVGVGGGRPGAGGVQPPPGSLVPPGGVQPPGGAAGAGAAAQPVEVENLLLRFIDCEVKPGHTYEYRIQLKMKSPNFGPQFKNLVLNPAWATDPKFETLRSPWVTISTPITIPQENFLFAYDPETYRKTIDEMYKGPAMAKLKARMQAKETQAVVQVQQWRQEVRTGDGNGKREPVGAWIVSEMPVGRGEYIGRKQYVKLPLWSSEANNYVLREIPDKPFKGKDVEQPKGWLVDFSDQSVLVDFEGGKVRATVAGRSVDDDVAEELLILGRDGRLLVRSSLADENDPNRKAYTGIWERWLSSAEKRKSPGAGGTTGGEFEGGRPGSGGPGSVPGGGKN